MSGQQSWRETTEFHVRDIGISKDFYQRVFGLHVVMEEKHRIGFQLSDSAILVLCSETQAGNDSLQSAGPEATHDTGHVCLPIPEASLDEWGRYLMLNGVAVEYSGSRRHGGTSVFCRDPDGHSFELVTKGARRLS